MQGLDVGLGGGMIEHIAIHGRRQQQRTSCRQRAHCQQVVRHALRQLRQCMGSDGRDDQQIGGFCQTDVRNVAGQLACIAALPQFFVDRPPRNRLEGQRAHESLGSRSHDDIDLGVGVSQLTGQIDRFVGGNAATDAQYKSLAAQI